LHQVSDLFELNVKLLCQKVKENNERQNVANIDIPKVVLFPHQIKWLHGKRLVF
jgi:hypothetical protein